MHRLCACREKFGFTASILSGAKAGVLHLAHLLGLSGPVLATRLQVCAALASRSPHPASHVHRARALPAAFF